MTFLMQLEESLHKNLPDIEKVEENLLPCGQDIDRKGSGVPKDGVADGALRFLHHFRHRNRSLLTLFT